MTTAIDTNALLGILYDDSHADASETALRRAYREGKLVVTPVVCGTYFPSVPVAPE